MSIRTLNFIEFLGATAINYTGQLVIVVLLLGFVCFFSTANKDEDAIGFRGSALRLPRCTLMLIIIASTTAVHGRCIIN